MSENKVKKPVILVVLDGFGIPPLKTSSQSPFKVASKPSINEIEKYYPFTTLQASGIGVGLPVGESGNSEVGHLTMGAGRVLYQHLPRIISSIKDRSFFSNESFIKSSEHVKKNGSMLHMMGLFSTGSVHAYSEHLYALIEFAREQQIPAMLHIFTDGKDAPVREAAGFIANFEKMLEDEGYDTIKIASVMGRMYSMDRDGNWDLTAKAYDCLTGNETATFSDPASYILEQYDKGAEDVSIEPACRIGKNGEKIGRIKKGDSLIIFNFREDSIRQITKAFSKKDFNGFDRDPVEDLLVVTMTEYEKDLHAEVAFMPLKIEWPLARVVSESGRKQLHIAETQKYAHVTYFFNGGVEEPFPNEDRVLIPSPQVKHIDESPEMSASKITETVIEKISEYDFILVNFANTDMVGHTGDFGATIKAVEVVDGCIGKIMASVLENDGILLITGDHGNAEEKFYSMTGRKRTKHTTNVVPLYLIMKELKRGKEREPGEIEQNYKYTKGVLTDIAPTIIDIMKLEQPGEMKGVSLLPKLIE